MPMLTIRIDAKLEKELKRIAKARGRTKSQLVREMLRQYTTLELFEAARRRLTPYAEKAGWLTDEDVFREVS
jgi:predicted transcriptional regulator